MTTTLPKLTSLSTQTLTLVYERQRLQALSSSSGSGVALPTSSLTQITRNFTQLRTGIYALEESNSSANGNGNGNADGVSLLRAQYEKMRDMLGTEKELVEALEEPKTQVVAEESNFEVDPMTLPYKDDPEISKPYVDAESDTPFDAANELESQQLLMQEQDTRLEALHGSISRQHSISRELSSELDTQAGLLDQLDTELDETSSRLGRARKALDKFSRGMAGNGSTYTIAALILILLLLIIIFKT